MRFARRFERILDSLVYHSDILDKEALSIDISRAEEWRRRAKEDAAKHEESLAATHLSAVLSWLDVQDSQQEDVLDEHLRSIYADSCQWIQGHRKTSPWLSSAGSNRVLWMKGNPGAGEYFDRLSTQVLTASQGRVSLLPSSSILSNRVQKRPFYTTSAAHCLATEMN